MGQIIRTYSELIKIPTFLERFEYLKLRGRVGEETFGYDRYINQKFYTSKEWRRIRDQVIIRDNGCDLAVEGYEIFDGITVHHVNPITADDIINRPDYCLDPEFLVCVSYNTHKAISYSDESLLTIEPIVRLPNDTIPWRK
jgi:hypothetical protein